MFESQWGYYLLNKRNMRKFFDWLKHQVSKVENLHLRASFHDIHERTKHVLQRFEDEVKTTK